ncbi:MAG: branched-chain amino acid ABC transporter permease, partial [Acidimicrobiia bacterium]|nr:branched-chain amino acid ABC transporter permease [Acidimicrobiia bacterium]
MNLDWLDAFLVYGLFSVMMVIGLALLLHLQLGLARIANFGIVGFWGLGMYSFGVLFVKVDWPFGEIWAFLISAAFATLVAGLAGLAVGWVIADLDIDGVLVGTLGFATCVVLVATVEQDLTGGALGMGGLGFPYDIGSVKANETLWLVILTAVVGFILFYVSRVHKAPYGRLLISLGDNEPLARSLGKQSFRRKLLLFAGSSAVMGLLGAMFGVMERFLDIGNLGIEITLAAMVGLVLGGTTRAWGGVVGVALTVAVFD